MKLGRRDWLKLGAMAGAGLFPIAGKTLEPQAGADPSAPRQRWSYGADPGQTLPPEAVNGPWRNLRAVKEKKVFDIHCHPWGQRPGHQEAQDNTTELIKEMDYCGIAQVALSPARVPYETIMANDVVPHLDRFIRVSGMPTNATQAKDLTPDLVAEQYRQALERDGCKMVGETAGSVLQNLQSRYSVSELKPIIDVVRKYNVPVLMHTGWTAGYEHIKFGQDMRQYVESAARLVRNWPDYVGSLLSEYPDVNFILGHIGGALAIPDGHEALRLLFSYENAYVDTSTSPVEIISEAVRGVGAERVMFGSDWNSPGLLEIGPFHLRGVYTHWSNLNNIANADLTEDQRDWVLYKSARKLLKLPEA